MATIDLNRIAVFVRVAEAGSFTVAARSLGTPVSSVSRAITNLENELGVRLLHRTTRKLSLTDGGRDFFQRMQAVIAETEAATLAVTGFASEPRGPVRITAPPDLGAQQFPQIIAKLARRYPGIVFQVQLTSRIVDLVEEGIDLAIRGGVLKDSSLVARRIAGDDLGIYAAPAYLERRGRPRSLAELTRHDCIGYVAKRGRLAWRLKGPRGYESVAVSGPIAGDDMIFLRETAIAGMGLTLLPLPIAAPAVKSGKLVRVLPSYGQDGGALHLVWPSQRLVPARVVAVRELLIEELRKIYA